MKCDILLWLWVVAACIPVGPHISGLPTNVDGHVTNDLDALCICIHLQQHNTAHRVSAKANLP
jgi:hypothetical protein